MAAAGGPFGPPQPVSSGGLYSAIGYWSQEDKYQHDKEYLIKQRQVYSELGYGPGDRWDIYGRVGVTGLKIMDAFAPATAATIVSKTDYEDNWKYFGVLGARAFYPVSRVFGLGALVQGTYYFNNFTDNISGSSSGTPFALELGLKKLWDLRFGLGLQAIAPAGIKMYIGPYLYYSEAKVSPSTNVPGLALAAGETTLENNTGFGGFAGIEAPLGRGFRLNLEGQYSVSFSLGAAVIYVY